MWGIFRLQGNAHSLKAPQILAEYAPYAYESCGFQKCGNLRSLDIRSSTALPFVDIYCLRKPPNDPPVFRGSLDTPHFCRPAPYEIGVDNVGIIAGCVGRTWGGGDDGKETKLYHHLMGLSPGGVRNKCQ